MSDCNGKQNLSRYSIFSSNAYRKFLSITLRINSRLFRDVCPAKGISHSITLAVCLYMIEAIIDCVRITAGRTNSSSVQEI